MIAALLRVLPPDVLDRYAVSPLRFLDRYVALLRGLTFRSPVRCVVSPFVVLFVTYSCLS